jgi:hypothetical protein
MSHNHRLCAALIVLAGAAVGLASPACADLSGTYNYASNEGTTATWTITPCGAGCANVASTDRTDGAGKHYSPWNGTAELSGGTWNLTIAQPDAITCYSDGSIVPGLAIFSWDATTLSGTLIDEAPTPGGACGNPPGSTTPPIAFTLTQAS